MFFLNLGKKTQYSPSTRLLLLTQKLPDLPESLPAALGSSSKGASPCTHMLSHISLSAHSCQQAFGLRALQPDPIQLRFVPVCSMLSGCLRDFSPCTDLNHIAASLENKLFINGALSCFLFLVSGLFQVILAASSY